MPEAVKRSVSLAIHDNEGRVLMVQRPPDDEDLPAVWGLPAATLRPGEAWDDAVRRAARDKLGMDVEPVLVLRDGSLDRAAYRLEMRLYEARLANGEPSLAGPDPGVTRYVDWRWGRAADLEPAAAAGSLCSALYLRWRE
jgi:ADP-ribose pyrophosphatase YjhB (NUDIX family)